MPTIRFAASVPEIHGETVPAVAPTLTRAPKVTASVVVRIQTPSLATATYCEIGLRFNATDTPGIVGTWLVAAAIASVHATPSTSAEPDAAALILPPVSGST